DLRGRKAVGQIQRKRAAKARRTDQPDLASQQSGDLAADGQSQAGAAVFAARAAVSLLESLENDGLFFLGNAHARIVHRKREYGRRRIQAIIIGTPSAVRSGYAQVNASLMRELEGIGKQVFDDLLQARAIGRQRAREGGIDFD